MAACPRRHWMGNGLAFAPKTPAEHGGGRVAPCALQPGRAQASQMARHVADQLRPKWPKGRRFPLMTARLTCSPNPNFPEQHLTTCTAPTRFNRSTAPSNAIHVQRSKLSTPAAPQRVRRTRGDDRAVTPAAAQPIMSSITLPCSVTDRRQFSPRPSHPLRLHSRISTILTDETIPAVRR